MMDTGARKSRRFPPDEGAVAWIDPTVREHRDDFHPTIPALVMDEAMEGCGLVLLSREGLSEEAECMVQVGNLAPLDAQVRWVKDLGDGVLKIGVMFLE
jgi:hypothetical protein